MEINEGGELQKPPKSHWEIVRMPRANIASTPEGLWNDACAYFKWCDDNPIKAKKTIVSGKDVGKKVKQEYPRPYTIKGLCLHCGLVEEYLRDVKNNKDKSGDYYHVVMTVLYIIYVQNLELATVGVFNPIFTAKLLNIETEDNTPSSVRVEIVNGLPKLAQSESEVLENLNLENGKVTILNDKIPKSNLGSGEFGDAVIGDVQ